MSSHAWMKLGFILNGVGYGWGEWRHAAMPADACTNLAFNLDQALTAERGKFDYLFIADGVHADADSLPKVLSHLEPIALLSAIAAVTEYIGLVATVSTSYSHPYNTARQLASLDKISRGRAGWNVVTTASVGAAQNFGKPLHADHAARYRQAAEFLDVARGLWDSFEPDAIIGDKANGIFLDKSKLHQLDHEGEFFRVRGPLNIDSTPQRHPVIFQAGHSEAGRDFAAQSADAVFLLPKDLDEAIAFTADVKGRAREVGRDPATLLVLPGITAIVGATASAADALAAERTDRTPIEGRVRMLAEYFSGYDFAGHHHLDDPFPLTFDERWLNGYRGDAIEILAAATRQGLTIREAALRFGTRNGDFVGTANGVADTMQRWFEAGACDGFMLSEPMPGQLSVFVDSVVPILQQRNLFRDNYAGTTLRDHFGLGIPANRHIRGREPDHASVPGVATAPMHNEGAINWV